MALGLLMGLFGLGLRGVGTVGNAIEDSKAQSRTNNGTTYMNRNGRSFSSTTGHPVDYITLKKVDWNETGWLHNVIVVGDEAYEGDRVIVDRVTHRIIKNITQDEAPLREQRRKEFEKKYEEKAKLWREADREMEELSKIDHELYEKRRKLKNEGRYEEAEQVENERCKICHKRSDIKKMVSYSKSGGEMYRYAKEHISPEIFDKYKRLFELN